jgi:hypothetical protein
MNKRKSAVLNERKSADMNERKRVDLNERKNADMNERKSADLNETKNADMNERNSADLFVEFWNFGSNSSCPTEAACSPGTRTRSCSRSRNVAVAGLSTTSYCK